MQSAAPNRVESFKDESSFDLLCSSCGYGIARSTPPERCPMCQTEGAWTHAPWRPFTREP